MDLTHEYGYEGTSTCTMVLTHEYEYGYEYEYYRLSRVHCCLYELVDTERGAAVVAADTCYLLKCR